MTTLLVCAVAAIVVLGTAAIALVPLLIWSGVTAYQEARELRAEAAAIEEFLAQL